MLIDELNSQLHISRRNHLRRPVKHLRIGVRPGFQNKIDERFSNSFGNQTCPIEVDAKPGVGDACHQRLQRSSTT